MPAAKCWKRRDAGWFVLSPRGREGSLLERKWWGSAAVGMFSGPAACISHVFGTIHFPNPLPLQPDHRSSA